MSSDTSKIALVTGASKRLGKSIALNLAREGWRVAIHFGSDKSEAEQLVAEINAIHKTDLPAAISIQADLSNSQETETIIKTCVDQLGPPSCLVNNASLFERDDINSVTQDSWDAHLQTNVRAPLILAQQFNRYLPDDIEGNIVNLIDQRVWRTTPAFLSYSVSKSALYTLTKMLAQALAPRIRVNGIGPGPTLPSKRQTTEQFESQVKNDTLTEHATSVNDIANTVLYLLITPSITGQMIALDGGQHLAADKANFDGLDE